MLPAGLATKDHYLFNIVDEESGATVGMVWFATGEKAAPDSAFLYNFEIYERYRRQGYGMQALQALEEKVRELGVSKILLHVFGHNLAARNLYEKMGYEITGIHMAKNVS